MSEAIQKSKKIDPVVRARKIAVDLEAKSLAEIRTDKVRKVAEVRHNQREYLKGVDRLNVERQKSQPEMLEALESSVDLVKGRWQDGIRDLRILEDQEKAQLANLLVARKHLRAVEQLQDRYQKEIALFEEKMEQKALDELSARKSMRNQE